MTTAGRVGLIRRSLRCPRCGVTVYPLDDRIGLAGFLSPGATRLACLAAASWSFDVALALSTSRIPTGRGPPVELTGISGSMMAY